MRRPALFFWSALLVLLALGGPATVRADSPAPPHDYTQVTENGEYIFVMLSSNAWGAYNQKGEIGVDKDIRAKYTQSGLYLNDGSTTPLWTVDWYSFDVEVSSDGEHLVKYGPWAGSGNYEELALAFYENGIELRSYSVSDLVAFPQSLPHSVSHYMWLKDSRFDDGANRLHIETLNGERYEFDVTTGQIVEGSTTGGGSMWAGSYTLLASGGLLLILLAGLGSWLIRW